MALVAGLLCYIIWLITKKEKLPPNPTELAMQPKAITANADAQPSPPKAGAIVFKGFVSVWKKIWFFVQLRDGFWSVPLFFFLYYEVGVIMFYWFGGSKGFYDPSFIQPIFLAGAVVIAAMAIFQFILYFYFRSVHRWIWGRHRKEEQIIVNYSKDDFKNLTSWQRTLVTSALLVFLVSAILAVYLKMR